MRLLSAPLAPVLIFLLSIGVAAAAEVQLAITTNKAWYQPGETAQIQVLKQAGEIPADAVVNLRVFHLTQEVAHLEQAVGMASSWTYTWQTPPQLGGFGLEVTIEQQDRQLAHATSALDVANTWTTQPRYGFVSDFSLFIEPVERNQFAQMNRLHLNALQFYDWMYRHDTLIPPTKKFTDSLGRSLDLDTVAAKIRLAREYGMAPMAYAAIYAASPQFAHDHPTWGLYDNNGQPLDFGNGYLYLMNPARGSGWHDHLISELQRTVKALDFAGIHLDQYGYPVTAQPAPGTNAGPVNMPVAFRNFIDDAKEALSAAGVGNSLTFNAVANWPAAMVAQSNYDFNYIEVWPPYNTYGDIERIAANAYDNSGGKATVIAAYVNPQHVSTVRLLDAIVAAHGATHIELGEGNGMLADPYFPKYARVGSELWQALVQHYDFIVRYRDLLYSPRERLDHSVAVQIAGQSSDYLPTPGHIHPVLYRLLDGHGFTLSLINLTGAKSAEWKVEQPTPIKQASIPVEVTLDKPVLAVLAASPDGNAQALQALAFAQTEAPGGVRVQFTLPSLQYWSLVYFPTKG